MSGFGSTTRLSVAVGALAVVTTAGGAATSGAAPPAAPPPAARASGFTVVTKECGLGGFQDALPAGLWTSGLHLLDLDGDGDLDFFLSAHGGGSAVAALNDGTGRFARAAGTYPESEIHLACDVDEDGKLDLSANDQDGGGKWWRNVSASAALRFEPFPSTRAPNSARANALADIDGDGKLDWIRGTREGVSFDLGDGHGGFAADAHRLAVSSGYRFEHAVTPADIDGDGDADLLVEWGRYAFEDGKSRIYRNDGGMRFTDVTAGCGLVEDGVSIRGVGDLDGDGSTDIMTLERRERWEIYLNDGKGRFARRPGAMAAAGAKASLASWGLAAVTDFDNDGRPDIIADGKHYLKVFRGTGGGRFDYANEAWGIRDLARASVDDGICFGDIDGDGDVDIIGYAGPIDANPTRFDVYRNDLPKRNWIRVRTIGRKGNRAAAGARIRIYAAGSADLLASEEVGIYGRQSAQNSYGFAATERHFGLGDRTSVDVEVTFRPSGEVVRARGAKANKTIRVYETPAGRAVRTRDERVPRRPDSAGSRGSTTSPPRRPG